MDINKLTADCTVKSQESNLSDDVSKNSVRTGGSKHSKEILIHNDQSRSHRQQVPANYFTNEKKKIKSSSSKKQSSSSTKIKNVKKDDTNFTMITSCGQLLFGIILITFGILVLVHGVSLGTSGAGLWAGMGALVAGALGLVATLASSSPPSSSSSSSSGFATAHLATSLVALGLANLSTIAALNAIVRDYTRLTSQDSADLLLPASSGDGKVEGVETSWSSLLASFGLLLSSLLELLVAGYTCFRLSPKICGCLAGKNIHQGPECEVDSVDAVVAVGGNEFDPDIGKLKTKNMVHQWVIAQAHSPKNSPPPRRPPFYIVHQPVMALQPVVQTPYGAVHYPKYPGGYLPAYGPIPMIPPVVSPQMQMYRPRQKRYPAVDHQHHHHRRRDDPGMERRVSQDSKTEPKRMKSIGENDDNKDVDLSLTYTGLDKKISEEFISIAMDPERKSKASSHYGSEIDAKK